MDKILVPSFKLHRESQFTDENKAKLEELGKLWINKVILDDIHKWNKDIKNEIN